jgi:hypothetical protein
MAPVVVIMLLGVPVGFAFGLGGFAILAITGLDPRFAIPAAFRNLESYTLMALPLFISEGFRRSVGNTDRSRQSILCRRRSEGDIVG